MSVSCPWSSLKLNTLFSTSSQQNHKICQKQTPLKVFYQSSPWINLSANKLPSQKPNPPPNPPPNESVQWKKSSPSWNQLMKSNTSLYIPPFESWNSDCLWILTSMIHTPCSPCFSLMKALKQLSNQQTPTLNASGHNFTRTVLFKAGHGYQQLQLKYEIFWVWLYIWVFTNPQWLNTTLKMTIP